MWDILETTQTLSFTNKSLEKLRPELEVGIPSGRSTIDLGSVETVTKIKTDHAQHRCLYAKTKTQRTPELQRIEIGDFLPGITRVGEDNTVNLLFGDRKAIFENRGKRLATKEKIIHKLLKLTYCPT